MNKYYILLFVAMTTALSANILDEELDLHMSGSGVGTQHATDQELLAFEQELARLAQEAQAEIKKEDEEEKVAPQEEVLIIEEEEPSPSIEAVQQEELQRLLAELEAEEQQDDE